MNGSLPRMAIAAARHADICDTVRRICEGYPATYWRACEDAPTACRYPEAFIAELEAAGIMGALVPEAYAGVGLPLAAAASIATTIHETGCNAAAFVSQCLLTALLVRHGNPALKTRLLPQLAAGAARLQTLALTEEGVGDEVARMTMTATDIDGETVLCGRKSRACLAASTDHMVVLARSDAEAGTSLYLVEGGRSPRQEIRIHPLKEMNNDGAASLVFDRYRPGADALIGQAGTGEAHLDDMIAVHRILAAACAVGDGRFFSRRGVAYANERTVFGNPIGKYQGIQFPLAKAHVELESASLSMAKAATLYDGGVEAAEAALVARHLAVEAAWAMADAAFTTHGGFAFAREYDIERKWRDVRAMRVAATPFRNDLARIGESALGLPRSY